MGELVPGVSIPPETLRPPPVCRDADEKVGQPAGALVADLGVPGHLPLVVQRGLIAAVETDKVMEVLQCRGQGVELVRELIETGRLLFCMKAGLRRTHPEISENHQRYRSQEDPDHDLYQPAPRLVLQHLEWVEEEESEGDHHDQGGVEGGYGEEVSEDEGDDADGPDNGEPGGGLQEVKVS